MKIPLISCVIPVYNGEKFINNVYHNIIQQNYKNIEIIFVNNNSTDNSIKIIEKLAKIKTRLIYVTHHIDEILPLTTHVLLLKNGAVFSKGIKSKMLTGAQLSSAFDCHIELKKRSERYWITASRPHN